MACEHEYHQIGDAKETIPGIYYVVVRCVKCGDVQRLISDLIPAEDRRTA